jgi:hypothetical protein
LVTVNGATSVPPGFRIETFDEVIVTELIRRLIRWPAVPVKLAVEVPPAFETATVTAAPSGSMV